MVAHVGANVRNRWKADIPNRFGARQRVAVTTVGKLSWVSSGNELLESVIYSSILRFWSGKCLLTD
jgi:hypothetical protein